MSQNTSYFMKLIHSHIRGNIIRAEKRSNPFDIALERIMRSKRLKLARKLNLKYRLLKDARAREIAGERIESEWVSE